MTVTTPDPAPVDHADLRLTDVTRADVYKTGTLAAHLTRTSAGVEFAYTPDWIRNAGPPVATTLPVCPDPVLTVAGAVPAFFAGLLPEGRRLSALRRIVKTSGDDDLSLLLAVGSDPVGDVQVVPDGASPRRASPHLQISSFSDISFRDVLSSLNVDIDRAGLAGVQDKASLSMISVPVTAGGSSSILKLTPPDYPHLVENEAFFLTASARSRINTAHGRVVTDRDALTALVVSRFDRVGHGDDLRALAVEDACQVRDLYPASKYHGSLEEALSALVEACAAPLPAALEFLRQATFAYLSGNGDAHAKNFSILASDAGRFAPAPAYDLPNSTVYGDNTLALSVQGRRDGNLTGARFVALGEALGLPERAARRAVTQTARLVDSWIDGLDTLPFDDGVLSKLRRVVVGRRRALLEH